MTKQLVEPPALPSSQVIEHLHPATGIIVSNRHEHRWLTTLQSALAFLALFGTYLLLSSRGLTGVWLGLAVSIVGVGIVGSLVVFFIKRIHEKRNARWK